MEKENVASDTLRVWSNIVLACDNTRVRPVRVRNDLDLNLNCEKIEPQILVQAALTKWERESGFEVEVVTQSEARE